MPEKNINLMREPGDRSWKLPFSRTEMVFLLEAMLAEAGLPHDIALELVLLPDAAMEELNNTHMGCHGPTNVLSFPASTPLSAADGKLGSLPVAGSLDLGSLALSPDTFLRECLLYGQETEEHCLRLLAHGMAHLLGYDHGPEMDSVAGAMFAAATERKKSLF